mmetsp:Transcript_6931/g.9792  ORF Transcript_6931/g.9792 Transcript_6931/m.9792 type:complete len:166 (-) Transcript_6931:44-541(-)
MKITVIVIACLCSVMSTGTTAFAPLSGGVSSRRELLNTNNAFGIVWQQQQQQQQPQQLTTSMSRIATSTSSSTTTSLYSTTDGRESGFYLMGIVVALWIWLFSIPPEFRRARFCTEADTAIYDQCWTVQSWSSGVADYYKNGGGIKFDFSIDPATLEENAEKFGN